MPEAVAGAKAAGHAADSARQRMAKWGGGAVVIACTGFISYRLLSLDPAKLLELASWSLAAAMVSAPLFFAASDRLLCTAWSILAKSEGVVASSRMHAIYGRGVLTKYLPGSVFQYASRQVEGARAGLDHRTLAKASVAEIVLHLPASLTAGGLALTIARWPVFFGLIVPTLAFTALRARNSFVRAVALQITAFACFAAAATAIGAALLPNPATLGLFAAIFLLSWLAGFLIPVAPGGLGVREAALLVLAGGQYPAASLLACVLSLRIASIIGDCIYAAQVMLRDRRTAPKNVK